jgi:glycosyltransferase involved in cell wall biosynthesis
MTASTSAAGRPADVRPLDDVPEAVHLRGKRAAVVIFSYYPMDPRPRRAAETLVRQGMKVDLVCLRETAAEPRRETVNGVDVLRVPLRRRRGGTLGYLAQYAAFLVWAMAILAVRSVTRRYHLVHVHNMPDILVLSALVPKLAGAKVILDLHDPMPELMMTIFGVEANSLQVRLLRRLEKASLRFADLALTVNTACQRLFVSRGCPTDKMHVVMNSPDEEIFRFQAARPEGAATRPGEPFVIMYHGSLVERNGLDLAVDALARVRATIPDARLKIYGSATPFLERVLESVRAQGLATAVEYLGPRRLEDIVRAIQDCDVGIIPNQRSLFTELNTPTRIFEYLAIGKPVIAPRAPGILDYFDEDSLIYFELGDSADLARRLEHVIAHPREAAETARRGQAVYRDHTWQRERDTFVRLADGLLGRRRRSRVTRRSVGRDRPKS